ncbi:Holliday junction branch migration protein RuvA [Segetibacter aerophilus]|uniref:Holliday junction branch migration complex subunit RuvA n=1 Tax=Segetibacter aerophilus TaxID=670293 RepID=A0A512BBE4_9BACT|nr:Holliday junction branch migration protein RuvA [Segetibacter aerophilus]GEO09292.1 Holliday junction ATP-dependent DNA helicase RuvA [Segetibacter aerophilus]
MIAFVRGKFAVKNPAQVIVDVNGVGYECQVSLNTYSAISNQDSGQLFTYVHITENNQTLYGFADLSEKELFTQLISVSGVGAATARMMLSGMKPDEIIKAIVQSNARLLESIKGIGRKTAERLCLELKDKLSKNLNDIILTSSGSNKVEMDALNALISLGIPKPNAEKALKNVIEANGTSIQLEDLIKKALKNI